MSARGGQSAISEGLRPVPAAVRLLDSRRGTGKTAATSFFVTFPILALKLAVIRWMAQRTRSSPTWEVSSLIGAFLGMGLGVALGRRTARAFRSRSPGAGNPLCRTRLIGETAHPAHPFPGTCRGDVGDEMGRRASPPASPSSSLSFSGRDRVPPGRNTLARSSRLGSTRRLLIDLAGSFAGVVAMAIVSSARLRRRSGSRSVAFRWRGCRAVGAVGWRLGRCSSSRRFRSEGRFFHRTSASTRPRQRRDRRPDPPFP